MTTMTRERGLAMGRSAALERSGVVRLAVPVGRLLFSLIFLTTLQAHLSPMAVGYAAQQGVPFASVLVPLSGVMAFAGGVSVLLGYRVRLGAALLVLFLVPVTLTMHAFWTVADPMAAALERAMFLKNVGLLGGALFIIGVGAGPLSLDARRREASSR